MSEIMPQIPGTEARSKVVELRLRDAVSRFGNIHPEVLKLLTEYISALRAEGLGEKAEKLLLKAVQMSAIIEGKQADAAEQGDEKQSFQDLLNSQGSSDASHSTDIDKKCYSDSGYPLYDSSGRNIAVAYKGALFTPDGECIGRYMEEFQVFLDKRGWYLGHIVDENRLACERGWAFRHLNFGDRGNEGNHTGWGTSADISRTCFDYGFDDVNLEG